MYGEVAKRHGCSPVLCTQWTGKGASDVREAAARHGLGPPKGHVAMHASLLDRGALVGSYPKPSQVHHLSRVDILAQAA
jgi:hypothetical protein